MLKPMYILTMVRGAAILGLKASMTAFVPPSESQTLDPALKHSEFGANS